MRKRNNMRHGGGGGGRGGHRGGGRYHQGGHRSGGGNEQQNLARQKHHAMQMREKYVNMARDAQIHSDRVDVEYYLQHVDHYTRVLTDIAAIEAERYAAQREAQAENGGNNEAAPVSDDANTNGGNADMGEPITTGNQPRMTRHQRPMPAQQPSADTTQDQSTQANDIPLPGSALPAI